MNKVVNRSTAFNIILLLLYFIELNAQTDSITQVQIKQQIKFSFDTFVSGSTDKALEIALGIEKKFVNPEDTLTGLFAEVKYYIARYYFYTGKVAEAEKNCLIALQIIKPYGNEGKELLKEVLSFLTQIYYTNGEFQLSERYCNEYIQSFNDEKDVTYVDVLNSLALVYYELAKFEKVETTFQEARDIQVRLLGTKSIKLAITLMNFGYYYFGIGNYEKAEKQYLESIQILQNISESKSSQYAAVLNMLATLYKDQQKYEQAEKLYLEALDIRTELYGPESMDVAIILDNVSNVYLETNRIAKALEYLERSNKVWYKIVGKNSVDYSVNARLLANVYDKAGYALLSDSLYRESISTYRQLMGTESPQYITYIQDYAQFCEKQGNYNKSVSLLTESDSLIKNSIIQSVSFMSEDDLTKFTNKFTGYSYDVLSYLWERSNMGVEKAALSSMAYNNCLFEKGFVLHALQKLNKLIIYNHDLDTLRNQFASCRNKLAKEYSKLVADRADVNELQEEADLLEKQLIRKVHSYSSSIRRYSWQDVQNRLKNDECVIEFVHFHKNYPHASDSVMYVAFVVTKNSIQPEFVSLFEKASIDSLMHNSTEKKLDYVNHLYSVSERGAIISQAKGRNLYSVAWEPLESKLQNIRKIFYAPSGLLHRINLEAIPINDSEILSDKYEMIRLNSTRELIEQIEDFEPGTNTAVLFGSIQYGIDSTLLNKEMDKNNISMRSNDTMNMSSSSYYGNWEELPATLKEINQIAGVFKSIEKEVHVIKGFEAREETFKHYFDFTKASPRIVHIATHGYFFNDLKGNKNASLASPLNLPAFMVSSQPMIRSGLIMAGANYAWKTGKTILENGDDGILTAYEISQLNFANTELVVLSACETGLGDIIGNEGVYGLQRAFKIAGAKYILMSLWQVPDKLTSTLMITFYKKWLEVQEDGHKRTIHEAFHEAQKELRELGLEPYHWAGFVLVE